MARQWKPGDVATVRCDASDWHPALRVGARDGSERWICAQGGGNTAEHVTEARPLVVIDPEDREQVERLVEAIRATARDDSLTDLAAALRSLVADPKPDEPQGLGAVVEDAEGRRWIRAAAAPAPWVDMPHQYGWQYWEAVAAVRVLSEGWSE